MNKMAIVITVLCVSMLNGAEMVKVFKCKIVGTDLHVSNTSIANTKAQAIIRGHENQPIEVKNREIGELVRGELVRREDNVQNAKKNFFCIEPNVMSTQSVTLKKLYENKGLEQLPRCYQNILYEIPGEHKTIAIAELGAGLPGKERAEIAVSTIINFLKQQRKYSQIHLHLEESHTVDLYKQLIEDHLKSQKSESPNSSQTNS